eukprot:5729313-Pyramimonas_sp.AAC.1
MSVRRAGAPGDPAIARHAAAVGAMVPLPMSVQMWCQYFLQAPVTATHCLYSHLATAVTCSKMAVPKWLHT